MRRGGVVGVGGGDLLSGDGPDGGRLTVRRDGVELSVLDEGDGAPVLLLHGFPDSLRLWDAVTDGLVAAGRRVVRFDQRGFGQSSAPAGLSPYRIDGLVADVIAVLDARGLTEPVDVVGHDWGAVIAWAACLAHPERFARHVSLTVGHPSSYRSAGLDGGLRSAYVVGFLIPRFREWAMARQDWLGLRRWGLRHPRIDDCIADCRRPGRMTAGLSWYRANVVTIFTRRWGRCRVPTLGVWCEGDDYLSEAQMARSARWMDAPWTYRRVEGAGHWWPLEAPADVVETVLAWLGG